MTGVFCHSKNGSKRKPGILLGFTCSEPGKLSVLRGWRPHVDSWAILGLSVGGQKMALQRFAIRHYTSSEA
jgi:hypothetical protein